MTIGAERSNAAQQLDRADRALDGRPIAADADSSLTTLVRQWVKTSEAVERQAVAPLVPRPALPRRHRQPQARSSRRLAVLIDAASTTADYADALFAVLADHGTVSVCRAYADWTAPEAGDWWSAPLRQHGIQPHHHFGHDGDQRGLVALTVDAMDLARESAVDTVVIVGDLTSMHPLVARLNATGLKVLAFGTTDTPDDVRALSHEFVDLTSMATPGSGRHRA
ncbi:MULTISPECIES: NYN domain-containing protein [Nocardioides]|uniref:NYN domain-containing protein n=1 Tax=Nocardioides TaxID=1839 RepID=UPI0003F8E6D2|nr:MULTISPECIES: NYN domain-containing protein [Nocardioides]